MRLRVEAHQRARQDRGWETVEEQVDLPGVLDSHGRFNVVLVDCLTLWVNNLMYQAANQIPLSLRERAGVRGSETDSASPSSPSPVERERGESDVPLSLTESDIARISAQLIDSVRPRTGTVIFVSNEVGMGIVPENADARRFRDLAGRANQVIAAAADEVTLLISGIAWHLKGKPQ
jgi:adenosylcobinamide kinase/adenosylcobinamide-phosphate guanylyltransferase